MTIVIAQPGLKGFDAAFPPTAEEAKAAGADFWSIYVGGNHDERDLIDEAFAAGLLVMWNYERSETAWRGGYQGGRSQALNALVQAEAFGWDRRVGIVFSGTDATVPGSEYPIANAFYKGIADVFDPLPSPWGAYGDHVYLGHLSVQPWVKPDTILWQWMNNGPTLAYATIRQTGHGTVAGHAIDWDLVKKPVAMQASFSPPDPPAKGEDMAYLQLSDGSIYEVALGYKMHCTPSYFFDTLGGVPAGNDPGPTGIVAVFAPDEGALLALPDWPGLNPQLPDHRHSFQATIPTETGGVAF